MYCSKASAFAPISLISAGSVARSRARLMSSILSGGAGERGGAMSCMFTRLRRQAVLLLISSCAWIDRLGGIQMKSTSPVWVWLALIAAMLTIAYVAMPATAVQHAV